MSPELQRSVTCDYVTTDSAKDLGRAKITEKNKICSNKRRVYYIYILGYSKIQTLAAD